MQKMLFFLVVVLVGAGTVVSAQDQAWIVLDFAFDNGTLAQMAFNNPAYPDVPETECKKSVSRVQHSLVKAAIQKEPRLAALKFLGARCVMSTDDPIKPK